MGDLVLAAACRPDLGFEVHLLTQSLPNPTKDQEMQLHKVLRYLKGTWHYTLSLHPTTQMAQERASNLNLVAFSSSSWTEACKSTSTAYVTLWGAHVIASLQTCCAYNQATAELHSVRLALQLACRTKSLLQQLSVEQLAHKHVNISLRISSWHDELVTGRPLAMQLGLSRKNKRLQLRSENGQLHLCKVIPDKNLACSLTNIASDSDRMLAKLRVFTGAAEIGALFAVPGQGLASFGCSSSLVGGVIAETPAMASHQLRQLDLTEPDYESFRRTSFERSSLTLPSLRLQKSNQESFNRSCFKRQSLTLHSVSLAKTSLQRISVQSLNLHSLSLAKTSLQRTSVQSLNLHSLSLAKTSLQRTSVQSLNLHSLSLAKTSLQRTSVQSLNLPSLSLAKDSLQRISVHSLTLHSLSFDRTSLQRLSFQSLILHRLSLAKARFQRNSFESLTVTSLSVSADKSDSLILPSCILQSDAANSLTLQSLSFPTDSFEEIENKTAHTFATGRAETNSFSRDFFQEELAYLKLLEQIAYNEAGTNSLIPNSFLERILSLNRCLRTFLFVSFQLTCAVLFFCNFVCYNDLSEFQCTALSEQRSQLDQPA